MRTEDKPRPPWRRPAAWALAAVLALALAAGAVMLRAGLSPAEVVALAQERPPGAALRYIERRLDGHPRLEAATQPVLDALRARLEREPAAPPAELGKGQRTGATVPVRFDAQGRPQPAPQAIRLGGLVPPTRVLGDIAGLREALASARPGDVLELAPGRYVVDRALVTRSGGEPGRPIVLRAAEAGSVTLLSQTVEALVLRHPHWVVENLDWQGRCRSDNGCEHAVHVVGRARGTVIVNNRMTDFNAHVKVNGDGGHWPDDGLLQFNTLQNTRPRDADRPVAPVDLVAASGWQVVDNLIVDFARTHTRRPAYGLFMKGGGSGGRIERNVVICTRQGVSRPGIRVGIGVGSGGTAERFCRGQRCEHEHADAVVANNVVAHCNDLGIDVANSTRTWVLHNTLVNTAGIGVRNPPADARAERNLLEGGLYERRGTRLQAADNEIGSLQGLLVEADALQLGWRALPDTLHGVHPQAPTDFCGRPRPPASPAGATVGAPAC